MIRVTSTQHHYLGLRTVSRWCQDQVSDAECEPVPKEGLEPSHPKAQEPKSCVSTSSTTPALYSIASLATLARRGSRFEPTYFVVTPGLKACPVAPPQHGGARSGFNCFARYARSARIAL